MWKRIVVCVEGATIAAALVLAHPAAPQETVRIDHQAVGCVVANTFPELEASFQVATRVARARVYFRTAASEGWYYVEMTASGDSYLGRLPKPGKSLESFDYYIEATGASVEAGRTPEYTARVVARRAECEPGMAIAGAGAAGPASIGAPPGAPPLPAGFATAGLATAAGAAGGGVAAGAGTSTGLVLGAVGAAALGGAVALAAGGGDQEVTRVSASPAPSLPKTVEYFVNADQFANGPLARGDRLTFYLYSGGWPTLEQAEAGLAGHTASLIVDGVPLSVYYTDWWVSPGNPPDYHKQAKADWVATSGTHTVTGFWTTPGYRTVTRTFSVP